MRKQYSIDRNNSATSPELSRRRKVNDGLGIASITIFNVYKRGLGSLGGGKDREEGGEGGIAVRFMGMDD